MAKVFKIVAFFNQDESGWSEEWYYNQPDTPLPVTDALIAGVQYMLARGTCIPPPKASTPTPAVVLAGIRSEDITAFQLTGRGTGPSTLVRANTNAFNSGTWLNNGTFGQPGGVPIEPFFAQQITVSGATGNNRQWLMRGLPSTAPPWTGGAAVPAAGANWATALAGLNAFLVSGIAPGGNPNVKVYAGSFALRERYNPNSPPISVGPPPVLPIIATPITGINLDTNGNIQFQVATIPFTSPLLGRPLAIGDRIVVRGNRAKCAKGLNGTFTISNLLAPSTNQPWYTVATNKHFCCSTLAPLDSFGQLYPLLYQYINVRFTLPGPIRKKDTGRGFFASAGKGKKKCC